MSTNTELNQNPVQYVLYYCNSPAGQDDPTVYQTDLSDVCTFGYDGSDNFEILSWLIGGYSQPSSMTLLGYVLSDVLDFYNDFYTVPAAIAANEPYMISTADLNNIRSDSSMLGFVVYDTTEQKTKYFDGISWETTASKYLSSHGGGLSGDLDMNANNIIDIGTVYQASPSCIGIWTSASSAISFTANTPKLVSLGSFNQSINGKSDFSYDSSTGKCTYTGSPTRYFRVSINYSTTSLAVASTQTNYISLNGSTTISGQRVVNSYLLLGQANIESNLISDVIQLANNDTIQLGAQSSTTNNVTYSNISYAISQL